LQRLTTPLESSIPAASSLVPTASLDGGRSPAVRSRAIAASNAAERDDGNHLPGEQAHLGACRAPRSPSGARFDGTTCEVGVGDGPEPTPTLLWPHSDPTLTPL